MGIDEILLCLEIEVFCVVRAVISPDAVSSVRQEALEATMVKDLSQIYARHRSARRILKLVSSFLPFVTARQILSPAEELFGEHLRISSTNTIVTQPGNERGGCHADWPYNQEKAVHIQSPLSRFFCPVYGFVDAFGFHRGERRDLYSPRELPNLEQPYRPNEYRSFQDLYYCDVGGGPAGSVLLFDSKFWHPTATDQSASLSVEYGCSLRAMVA